MFVHPDERPHEVPGSYNTQLASKSNDDPCQTALPRRSEDHQGQSALLRIAVYDADTSSAFNPVKRSHRSIDTST